jgi:pimeloyl-ACP methyl ester carboxylesterase
VVGWSGGGLYAAACAALMGERVSALGLVAAPAPDDQVPWSLPRSKEVGRLAKADPRRAMAAAVAGIEQPLLKAADRAGEQWDSPSDVTTRTQPHVDRALREMWHEGLRPGRHGLAADLVAGLRPWSFAPSHLTTSAHLFYGDDDFVVDLDHARWWERVLPDANLTVVRGGHLIPFVAWPDILRAVKP